jgi:hypothetical protein
VAGRFGFRAAAATGKRIPTRIPEVEEVRGALLKENQLVRELLTSETEWKLSYVK